MPGMPDLTIDPHVILIGRPPIRDFLGFIRVQAVDGQTADKGALIAEWRSANEHLRAIERQEAGCADNPAIEPLPDALIPHVEAVASTAAFRKSFGYFPTRFAMVNLDQLVVGQTHVNLAFADQVKRSLGPSPTELDVLMKCIPLQQDVPQARVIQASVNSYSVVSPSSDLRFIEAALIDPAQIQGREYAGPPVAVVALVVGYGPNHLHVLNLEGRLILNNGSHRAYALRDMGIVKAPCIVQTLSTRDELELVNETVQRHPDRYLSSARPPLFKDYFDPKLRKIVPVPRKNHVVKVSFGVDQTVIPAV